MVCVYFSRDDDCVMTSMIVFAKESGGGIFHSRMINACKRVVE